MHTESLTVYKSELKIIRTHDGDELREQKIVASTVVEQRLSHLFMGLAIIGTMTGPLLVVLHTIPRSLFAGVFLVVGVSNTLSNKQMRKLTKYWVCSGDHLKEMAL